MVKCNQRLNIWLKSVFFLRAENILVGKSIIYQLKSFANPHFSAREVIPHAQPNLNML